MPFGKRTVSGYVLGTQKEVDFDPSKVKPVRQLLDPEPVFNAQQLRFFKWISEYYLSPLGEVIATALPSSFKATSKSLHFASDDGVNALAEKKIEGFDGALPKRRIRPAPVHEPRVFGTQNSHMLGNGIW